MKLSAAKKPKEQIQELASCLPVGKQVQVSFSKHTDIATLVSVTLATQASIKASGGNVPDKRKNAEGKEYTPPCVSLQFDNGTVYYFRIVLEDIDIEMKLSGAILHVPSADISIIESKGL